MARDRKASVPAGARAAGSDRFARVGTALAVAVWPFLFLARYTLGSAGIGNDFRPLYYDYKTYLLGMLATGRVPGWSPSEGAGFPFLANPFCQVLYPLNALYLAHYAALGGLSVRDYQLYTIGALAIYALGTLAWLRQLGVERSVGCVVSILAAGSLKMTELLRLPNALHAAAWMPWILYGITRVTTGRGPLRGAAILGGSLLMLATAGYPYTIVYTAFLAVPYALALLAPRTRSWLIGEETPAAGPVGRSVALLALAAAAPAVAVTPWLALVRETMARTVDRANPEFTYATAHIFSPLDTLGSWIYPPASQPEGWYSFGMAATLTILAFAIATRTGGGVSVREGRAAALAAGWIAVATWFSWGRESFLFTTLWPYLGPLRTMRVWGRLNVALVPAIALLLALALGWLVRQASSSSRDGEGAAARRRTGIAVVGAAAVVVAVQIGLLLGGVRDEYWDLYMTFHRGFSKAMFPFELVYPMMTVAAGIWLWVILGTSRSRWPAGPRTIVLGGAVALAAIELAVPANHQWSAGRALEPRTPFDVLGTLRDGFTKPRSLGPLSIVTPARSIHGAGTLENWGFQAHADLYRQAFDREGRPLGSADSARVAALIQLYGADAAGRRLFLSERADQATPEAYMADALPVTAQFPSAIGAVAFDGERLAVAVDLPRPLHLGYVDCWDPRWQVRVDGAPAALERLLGAYKAVRVPAGRHEVEFAYRAW